MATWSGNPKPNPSYAGLTIPEKVVFWVTSATITVWTGLITYALADTGFSSMHAATSAVFVALIAHGLCSLGVTRLRDLPFRRWNTAWSKWTAASWKRYFPFALIVLLLGLGLHDTAGLFYCWYERKTFLNQLSDGWHFKLIDEGPELIGRAHALFPSRPESYFIYQSARRIFAEQSGEENAEKLKNFSSTFLQGYEAERSLKRCPVLLPFLFCCSCTSESYFRLMRRIAMVESGDYDNATIHKPGEDDVDAYLLWLYHMSERKDLDNDERKDLYQKLTQVAELVKWQNSPVFTGIIDRIIQIEYLEAEKKRNKCPVNKMWKYTEKLVKYYENEGERSQIIPPNKTLIYFVLKQVSLNKNDNKIGMKFSTAFPGLPENVAVFLKYCPEYQNQFRKHGWRIADTNIDEIVEKMDHLVKPLRNDDEVNQYLTDEAVTNWMEFDPLWWRQRP